MTSPVKIVTSELLAICSDHYTPVAVRISPLELGMALQTVLSRCHMTACNYLQAVITVSSIYVLANMPFHSQKCINIDLWVISKHQTKHHTCMKNGRG